MRRRRGLPLGIFITLACTVVAHGQPATEAAKPQAPAQVSTKGIVTAKGERSIAIKEIGGGILHVIETPQTRVTGLRTAFDQIAISDVVRVDGPAPPDSRVITAREVEVLFAAEATERARSKPANRLWHWIKNGGVTIELP